MLTDLARANLSPRLAQVLELLAGGIGNRHIAVELGISIKTVQKHRDALNTKIGANGPVDLIVTAIRRGYLRIPVDMTP